MQFKSFLTEMAKLRGYDLVSTSVGKPQILTKLGVVTPDKGALYDVVGDPSTLTPKQRSRTFTRLNIKSEIQHQKTGKKVKLHTMITFSPSNTGRPDEPSHEVNVVTIPHPKPAGWLHGEYESLGIGVPFHEPFQAALDKHFETHGPNAKLWGITQGEDDDLDANAPKRAYSSNQSKLERFRKSTETRPTGDESGYKLEQPSKESTYFTIRKTGPAVTR